MTRIFFASPKNNSNHIIHNKRQSYRTSWLSLSVRPVVIMLSFCIIPQTPILAQSLEGIWRNNGEGRKDVISFSNGVFQRQQEFCSKKKPGSSVPPAPCSRLINTGRYWINRNTITVFIESGFPSSGTNYPYRCVFTKQGDRLRGAAPCGTYSYQR